MAIERIIKMSNPTLFDRIIGTVQDQLAQSLPWLSHVFGCAERLVKEVEGFKRYTPNIYLGRNEYILLTPSEDLGNYCFFTLTDPTEVAWARGERNRLTSPFSLIVWLDMRTIDDDDSRNRERVKDEILKVINGGVRLRNGHVICTAIYERAENVWEGFTMDEIGNQFQMAPYAAFRFEGTMIVDEDCY